ncbi:MAG: hypothetical protein ACOC3D_04380 [Pseudomonadota bacterium]
MLLYVKAACLFAAAALSQLTHLATVERANELDYVLVDGFPVVSGIPGTPVRIRDDRRGLQVVKTVHVSAQGRYRVLTHVVDTDCGASSTAGRPSARFLVAIQLLPAEGATSAQTVDLRNRFFAVYVRDDAQRIRVYADLTVTQMTDLTNRFLPVCPVT